MQNIIIFEGPRGSGKSSLIEDAFHYFTKSGKEVIKYILPGTTDATKAMRRLALHDSTITKLSRRLLQVAAGIEDTLNMEDIVRNHPDVDYILFDRSAAVSNFVYGALCGESTNEILIAEQAGWYFNDIDTKLQNLSYVFVYAKPEQCLERIKRRHKEKDYYDLELDEFRETTINLCYLKLFALLNSDARVDYRMYTHLHERTMPAAALMSCDRPVAFEDIVERYGFDAEFYQKNSFFIRNDSTRKHALSKFLAMFGEEVSDD